MVSNDIISRLDSFITNSKMLILLDPGHGGLDQFGNYTTAPKKMFDHGDGFVINEGVFNRSIVKRIKYMLKENNISYIDVVSSNSDISLGERVRRANTIYSDYKNKYKVLYISIHGNASGSGKASGIELYTSKGKTKSDSYAEVTAKSLIKTFPNDRFRQDTSDGDLDKEENFYVLYHTKCPAMLIENFFFDNLRDAILMDSKIGKRYIAKAHTDAICEFERCGGF